MNKFKFNVFFDNDGACFENLMEDILVDYVKQYLNDDEEDLYDYFN